jgi:hypothetical protein
MHERFTEIQAHQYEPAAKLCKKYGLGRYRLVSYLGLIATAYKNSVLPSDAAIAWASGASNRSVVQDAMRTLESLGLVEQLARSSSSGRVWNLTKTGEAAYKESLAVTKGFQNREQ